VAIGHNKLYTASSCKCGAHWEREVNDMGGNCSINVINNITSHSIMYHRQPKTDKEYLAGPLYRPAGGCL